MQPLGGLADRSGARDFVDVLKKPKMIHADAAPYLYLDADDRRSERLRLINDRRSPKSDDKTKNRQALAYRNRRHRTARTAQFHCAASARKRTEIEPYAQL